MRYIVQVGVHLLVLEESPLSLLLVAKWLVVAILVWYWVIVYPSWYLYLRNVIQIVRELGQLFKAKFFYLFVPVGSV